ncbi:MAG TPA: hypothetical protein VF104_10730 [Burkholderiales bacterium]
MLWLVSPIAALAGGGLLIVREPDAGGVFTASAGIGMLIGWWGPIGWILGPLFVLAGAVALGFGMVSYAIAIVLPIAICAGTIEMFGSASTKLQLAKTEARISDVQGTLRWQEESLALKAEQERLRALVEAQRNQSIVALGMASLVGGVAGLGIGAIVRRRNPAIAKGLIFGGGLCIVQGALVLLA